MALVITWKPGDEIFIGGRPMKLVEPSEEFQKIEFQGKPLKVVCDRWTELFPGCSLRMSYHRPGMHQRIQIYAPNIEVLRADRYHQEKH